MNSGYGCRIDYHCKTCGYWVSKRFDIGPDLWGHREPVPVPNYLCPVCMDEQGKSVLLYAGEAGRC